MRDYALAFIGLFLVGVCVASFGIAVMTVDWRWLLLTVISYLLFARS